MRVLVVRPGPDFSVEDVANGWAQSFADLGCETQIFAMGERLDFFSNAKIKTQKGRYVHAFSEELAGQMTMEGLLASAMVTWPDVIVIVSGFYMTDFVLQVLRSRNMKIVLVCTESPYEEDRQLKVARTGMLDAILLNDPTHIDKYAGLAPIVEYQPHCYRPDVHTPGPANPEWSGDVGWVGTPYKESRLSFMERVDWTDLTLRLAGNWTWADGSPLLAHVIHDREGCFENSETVELYRSVKASFNIYRKEAAHPELSTGWALGPREIETIATGCFLAREPRGEGDELLPMLPTFTEPSELGDLLRWWCSHDSEREAVTQKAYEAIADRTFDNSARRLLSALEKVPATRQ